MSFTKLTRRGLIQTGAVAGAGLALPTYLRAETHSGFTNAPTGSTVTLGFNVPQTGPYAEEGLDELRAQELAVEHLNGEGDGGMMSTFSSKALKGNGILGSSTKLRACMTDAAIKEKPVPVSFSSINCMASWVNATASEKFPK